jgi:hypothetical protein
MVAVRNMTKALAVKTSRILLAVIFLAIKPLSAEPKPGPALISPAGQSSAPSQAVNSMDFRELYPHEASALREQPNPYYHNFVSIRLNSRAGVKIERVLLLFFGGGSPFSINDFMEFVPQKQQSELILNTRQFKPWGFFDLLVYAKGYEPLMVHIDRENVKCLNKKHCNLAVPLNFVKCENCGNGTVGFSQELSRATDFFNKKAFRDSIRVLQNLKTSDGKQESAKYFWLARNFARLPEGKWAVSSDRSTPSISTHSNFLAYLIDPSNLTALYNQQCRDNQYSTMYLNLLFDRVRSKPDLLEKYKTLIKTDSDLKAIRASASFKDRWVQSWFNKDPRISVCLPSMTSSAEWSRGRCSPHKNSCPSRHGLAETPFPILPGEICESGYHSEEG